MVLGRFAPTPSGRMHLGNVFSSLLAWLSAKSAGGEILLRIEDLDTQRTSPEYAEAIRSDLRWLGLIWDRQSENQSRRSDAYAAALDALQDWLYPCFCTRSQLAAAAPHASDGRVIYRGTCRNLTPEQRSAKSGSPSLRIAVPDRTISFVDGLQGRLSMNLQREWGDFIVRRADGVAAYQLAVVVDDGAAGVTEVVRGRDLLTSVPVQLWLYEQLGLTPPVYYHVPMLLAPDGRRLSKRDRDLDLGTLRKQMSAERLIGYLAFLCGLTDRWEAVSASELAEEFSWENVQKEDIRLDASALLL